MKLLRGSHGRVKIHDAHDLMAHFKHSHFPTSFACGGHQAALVCHQARRRGDDVGQVLSVNPAPQVPMVATAPSIVRVEGHLAQRRNGLPAIITPACVALSALHRRCMRRYRRSSTA